MTWVAKLIIDSVATAQHANGEIHDALIKKTIVLVCVEMLLALAAVVCDRVAQLAKQNVGSKLSTEISIAIAEKALKLPLSEIEKAEVNEHMQRAKRDIPARPLSILQQLTTILRNSLTFAGYGVLLARFSPWAIFGLLIATLPVLVIEARGSRNAHALRDRRTMHRRRRNYYEFVLTSVGHAKELRVLELGKHLLSLHREMSESLAKDDLALASRRTWVSLAWTGVAVLSLYGCYCVIVMAAIAGRMSIGDMTLNILAYRSVQQALLSSLSALAWLYEDQLFLRSYFQFMSTPEVLSKTTTRDSSFHQNSGIRFENVGYCYPGQARWALRHVDLGIQPGSCTAIVGRNGAGKSTLVKLITRLYQPTEGRILLDGMDLNEWDEQKLRRRLSVCFQDYNRYEFTVRDSIVAGDLERPRSETEIQRALREVNAWRWVEKLPGSLDAQLGNWFETGSDVSGGQWQMLALARTIFRVDADIYIFDEPTSALDAQAQSQVLQFFRQNRSEKTLLMISHDITNIKWANQIILLRDGSVAESGTESELLSLGGEYSKLFSISQDRKPFADVNETET